METRLVEDDRRNERLAAVVRALLAAGRRVIVMSSRRKHLGRLLDLVGPGDCALYVGETSKRRKRARDEASKTARCLLATYNMGEEGLDIPALDALVLATPKSSLTCVEQCVGRILRVCPGKRDPVVVDFHEYFSLFVSMFRKRDAYYARRGYARTRTTCDGFAGALARSAAGSAAAAKPDGPTPASPPASPPPASLLAGLTRA